MHFEITPEPDDAERAAIAAALEAEEKERKARAGPSPWVKAVLPAHEEGHP